MTTSTPPAAGEFVSIPLKQLVDNPDNPRRQFDVTDLKELADSIRAIGVVEPIIVRPNGKGTSIFEIIAGHRRSRAAALAGLAAIPAIVKDLSDDQALEVALVENLQRKDLHPLDEAACFGAMRGRLKLTAAQIAAKCHRPEGYVASRLKLLVLSEAARKEFAKGTFGIGVANELARVEDRGAQEKALKGILGEIREHGDISPRGARGIIEENHLLRLANAPFDTTDPELVAAAGPCTTCPKRSGNQKALFPDLGDPDLCGDEQCFRQKCDLGWLVHAEKALAEGKDVMDEDAAKRVFVREHYDGSPNVKYDAEWQIASETSYSHSGSPTFAALAKKEGIPITVARDPHTMRVVELVPKADIEKITKRDRASDGRQRTSRTKDGAQAKKQKTRARYHDLAVRAIVDALREGGAPKDWERWAASQLVESIWSGPVKDTVRSRALATPEEARQKHKGGYVEDRSSAILQKWLQGCHRDECIGLIFELLIRRDLENHAYSIEESNRLSSAAAFLKVDLKKLAKQAASELAARKPKKAEAAK
jgi:ParB/RepB/Spo0J family partition protein